MSKKSAKEPLKLSTKKINSLARKKFKLASIYLKKIKVKPAYFSLAVILAILILALITFKDTLLNRPQEITQESNIESSELEPESNDKLKDVYEKEKNISLGENFTARYSIFENADYGYRFAYPVGFSYKWNGAAVEIIPKSNRGKIIITVNSGVSEVKVESAGTSENETAVLDLAADFIRSTFEFTGKPVIPNSEDRPRTIEGPVDKY